MTIAKSFTLVSVEGTEPSTTPVTVATPTIFKADPLFSVILPREGTELEIVVYFTRLPTVAIPIKDVPAVVIV